MINPTDLARECGFSVTEFRDGSLRVLDEPEGFTVPGDLRLYTEKVLEEAANTVSATSAEIKLALGEMSAQELRSVEAVMAWKRSAIRALIPGGE